MADSKAFKLETFVAVLPTIITAEEIKESFEKPNKSFNVVKVVLIGGGQLSPMAQGRTVYEDAGCAISGRSQGDGMAVYLITVLADVSPGIDLVEKAALMVKEKTDARAKREAEVIAKEAERTMEAAKKAAELAIKAAEEAKARLAALTPKPASDDKTQDEDPETTEEA
jgi:hypothetical protein